MNEPISIKEILAIIIKRGKAILCACVAMAVLGGCFQFYMQWKNFSDYNLTDEEREQIYQDALVSYETQKMNLEQSLIGTEEYIASIQKPISQNIVSIGHVEAENKEVEIERIRTMYSLMWDSADLGTELSNHPYTALPNTYLREVLSMVYYGNGTLVITAVADTIEGSRALCDAAFIYLESMYVSVAEATADHLLEIVSTTDKYYADADLQNTQTAKANELAQMQANCDSYRQQLAELTPPVKDEGKLIINYVSVAKWIILGAAAGFILVCMFAMAKYILMDTIESSRQMAALVGAPYLGSVGVAYTFWNRAALMFSHELCWDNLEDAQQYVAENLAVRIPERSEIALVTTMKAQDMETSVQYVCDLLRKQGHAVTCIDRAYTNPGAIRGISDNQYIIFVERPGKSSRIDVVGVHDLVKQLDGTVLGFLFV